MAASTDTGALSPEPTPLSSVQLGAETFRYRRAGQGPAVLLVHGIPTSSFLWRKVIPRLNAAGLSTIAPDLLGLGWSEGPAEADLSMPAQAARLVGLLDRLGVARAHVVAHDQGGAAAQILVAHHPERVASLTLTNCVAFDNWPVPAIRGAQRLAAVPGLTELLWQSGLLEWFLRSRAGLRSGVLRGPSLPDEALDEYIAPLRERPRRAAARRFLLAGDARYTMGVVEQLGRCETPTQVVWATEDRFLSASWAERLREHIPGCKRLVLIPFCGHFVPEERPERLAEEIVNFVKETPP